MTTTSARLLQLLSLLQSRRFWPGGDLAERLEISERTLRRDIDGLRMLGYPVDSRRGVDGGYQLAPGAALPPLILDDEEAIALGVGLHAAVHGATVTGVEEAAVRALAKVVKVMPAPLRRRIDALATMTVPAGWGDQGPRVDPAALVTLAQACRDGERLEFRYANRDDEESQRLVEPHRLVLLGRRWYLVAWDLSRFDWRSFRVDRLADPVSTGARCIPREPPGDDAADFVRNGIAATRAPHVVDAVVYSEASGVRARIGSWAEVAELDEGRCSVKISAETLDWAVVALVATGAEFEVLAPPELIDLLSAWSTRLARAASLAETRTASIS